MIKAKYTIESGLLKKHHNSEELAKAVKKSAKKLHSDIRNRILKSKRRTGKVYRIHIGNVTKKHRASARGEAPAILTRTLVDSIRLIPLGRYSWKIVVEAPYAEYLDSEKYLGRPFFQVEVDEHEKEHNDILIETINELTK